MRVSCFVNLGLRTVSRKGFAKKYFLRIPSMFLSFPCHSCNSALRSSKKTGGAFGFLGKGEVNIPQSVEKFKAWKYVFFPFALFDIECNASMQRSRGGGNKGT